MNNPVRTEDPSDPTPGVEAMATAPPIEFEIDEPAADAVVIRPIGDLDLLTAALLREALLPHVERSGHRVVLDLTGIGFLGSAGLSELVAANEAAAANGSTLLLVASTRAVLRPIEITGLSPLFRMFESTDAALADV
ncbi:MAG TPA: STAS domain-containing protein [Actinophytocola sp.]|uniref:STAS domain-containing protein n=1 Tax=Actinophytocola sp. TaxID=1872138 RepID=UPI002DBD49F6|nr:STAS domain-containing protein [Actinophytocola sp.]HEU5471743.1 STAS domain-containing protein [Actinophytocola sp.]